MIIQVNVKNGNDGKKVAILFPFGSYRVDFGHKKVEFTKNKFQLYDPDIKFEMEFCENMLTPKQGFEGVRHYLDSIDIHSYDYKVDIEYLDTTHGKIEMHSHQEGVEEVYVSVEEPYRGEICSNGESHKPWAAKTVAVKIINK